MIANLYYKIPFCRHKCRTATFVHYVLLRYICHLNYIPKQYYDYEEFVLFFHYDGSRSDAIHILRKGSSDRGGTAA